MFEVCNQDCSITLNYLKLRTAKLLADEITKDGIINPDEKKIYQNFLRSLKLPLGVTNLIRSEIQLQSTDKSAGHLNEAKLFSKLKIIFAATLDDKVSKQLCYNIAQIISCDIDKSTTFINSIFEKQFNHKIATYNSAKILNTDNLESKKDTSKNTQSLDFSFEANAIICSLISYKSNDFEYLNIDQAKIDYLGLLKNESKTYPCFEESNLPDLETFCEVSPKKGLIYVVISSFSADSRFKCNEIVDESCTVKLPNIIGSLLSEMPIETIIKNQNQLLLSHEEEAEVSEVKLSFHIGDHHILDCALDDFDKKIHERIIGEIYFHKSMSILK